MSLTTIQDSIVMGLTTMPGPNALGLTTMVGCGMVARPMCGSARLFC